MLFSPLFTPVSPVYPESRRELRRESRSARLQTASPTRLASPCLLQPPVVRDWKLQNLMPVTHLDITLTNPLASVENKGLTENLNPLDATLTKNIGGRGCYG